MFRSGLSSQSATWYYASTPGTQGLGYSYYQVARSFTEVHTSVLSDTHKRLVKRTLVTNTAVGTTKNEGGLAAGAWC
jgi:hypothetical protein